MLIIGEKENDLAKIYESTLPVITLIAAGLGGGEKRFACISCGGPVAGLWGEGLGLSGHQTGLWVGKEAEKQELDCQRVFFNSLLRGDFCVCLYCYRHTC